MTSNPIDEFEHTCEKVSQFSLVRNMTMEQVRILCRHLEPYRVNKGTTLLNQGASEHSDLIIVLEGELNVVRELVTYQPMDSPLIKLGPGDTVGILGFVDARPHSATVTASQDTYALLLTRKVFAHLVHHHVDIAVILLKNLITVAADIAYDMLDKHADMLLYIHGAYTRAPLPNQN